MSDERRYNMLGVAILLGIVMWILMIGACSMAFADGPGGGDCRGNSCNGGDGGGLAEYGNIDSTIDNTVSNSVENVLDMSQGQNQSQSLNNQITGGSLSNDNKYDSLGIGLSNSLGDVDINDCLGSTQWTTPLFGKQKLVLNKWCAAEVYDAKGLTKMAALTRCQIPEVRGLFEDDQSCVAANEISPVVATEVANVAATARAEAETLRAEQRQQQTYIEQLETRLVELEEKARRPAPRPTTRTVVQRQSFLSDEKKAALRALVDEDEDR